MEVICINNDPQPKFKKHAVTYIGLKIYLLLQLATSPHAVYVVQQNVFHKFFHNSNVPH